MYRTLRIAAAILGLLLTALLGVVSRPAGAAVDDVTWLCRPGLAANPCEIPLDTTEQSFTGTDKVFRLKKVAQSKRAVDCFYVYPTVSNQPTLNANKERAPEIVSIARYQASRFASVCRVFAPVYRQMTLAGLAAAPLGGAQLAYGDVKQAWESYLARYNKGRGVILIGHSQGTMMLRKLIREEIDKNAAIRARIVGGFLLGGNVTVAQGRARGGDFARVPVCTRKGQFGCVVAYSTYQHDPLPVSFFGNTNTDVLSLAMGLPHGAGYQVACTDPGRLSGDTSKVGVTLPSEPFGPGAINASIAVTTLGQVPTADTTWVTAADRWRGKCRTVNGANVFRFAPATKGSRTLVEFPPTWGTHIVDVNLGYDKLLKIAALQVDGWLAARG